MGCCYSINKNILENANYTIPEFSLNGLLMYGKVVYVYDGDTVHIVFNYNNILTKFNCRLIFIDSPEICPKNIKDTILRNLEIDAAIKSRNFLLERVSNVLIKNLNMNKTEIKELCGESTKLVWVKCYEFDKYGRLLVELFETKESIISINQLMIKNNHAVLYNGGTKKEFKPV
jgi:endonuclease YncB( thermonuclease family)